MTVDRSVLGVGRGESREDVLWVFGDACCALAAQPAELRCIVVELSKAVVLRTVELVVFVL